jgi:shikimate dehydrogenase
VAWALRESGAAAVQVWNRTAERAKALARELELEHVLRPVDADIVVNATSFGLDSGAGGGATASMSELGLDAVEAPAVVVDLVYTDATTPVVAWAEQVGARVVDGLEVLVRQGARSFERWTGRAAPVEVMRAAARAES